MIIEPGVNFADQYSKMVMKNKTRYPSSIIKAVKRYRKWKRRKDIWFEVDRANEMLDFVQSFVRHVKGPLAGQLMELELWEMFVFANMYGWYHKNEKGKIVRVIRESYVQVPKKNGKTIIAAGALLYAMYGEGELGADCYAAATDYEQAQMQLSLFHRQLKTPSHYPEILKSTRESTGLLVGRYIVIILMA